MGTDDAHGRRQARRSARRALGAGLQRTIIGLRSRRAVAAVLGAVLVLGGAAAVVVERAQTAQAAASHRQEVADQLVAYRAAQQELRTEVDAASDLLAQTSAEDSTQEARATVSVVIADALPLLREPSSDTAIGEPSVAVLAATTARLSQLRAELGAAHEAWQESMAEADRLAAEQAAAEAAAAQAAADKTAADKTAADKAAADKAAADAASAQAKPKATTTTTAPVYDGSNGRLDPSVLCAIPFLPDHQTLCRSLDDLVALSDAFRKQFGIDLPIDPWPESCYRSYAQQVATFERFGSPQAARPGTSNHGWGKALDIIDTVKSDGSWVYGFGTEGYEWLKTNGPTYGWVNPGWAQQSGVNPEPLHFEYVR